MKLFVGVTDNDWYNYLAQQEPDEVNFWQPGGRQTFRALEPYGIFLFKLHAPYNFIAGGGFFVRYTRLPVSLAWEAFGTKNGRSSYQEFRQAIYRYRGTDTRVEPDPLIGCIILTQPFFWPQSDWIPASDYWKRGIQQGKTYDIGEVIGRRLWNYVQERLHKYSYETSEPAVISEDEGVRYGAEQIVKPRLGQGAFRVLVTEAYQRRCAITGEKTLPVLHAAHIKPYSLNGPHAVSNGILLRQDLHTLFDRGYLTVTEDYHVEVSRRIKEDYGNGRDYYALRGKQILEIPQSVQDRPAREYLRWHNEEVYLG
ncbi:MAG: HNH endonuclease [Syntrophomonadaceae bacterium]|jgi:putative restriction endonuclease